MKSLVSFYCSFTSFANQSVFAPINCLNCDSDTAIHTFWDRFLMVWLCHKTSPKKHTELLLPKKVRLKLDHDHRNQKLPMGPLFKITIQ